MKIPDKRLAILSPVAWRTPPRHYGAWETVASNITEGLVSRGWDVTLFATKDSVTAIKEIGATIGHISEIASAIAAAVDQQGAATQQIAHNVQSAATGTADVTRTISDVAKGSSETGAATNQLLTSARALSDEGSRLKSEVEKFLRSVRAG